MFFACEHGSRFVIWEDEQCTALLYTNDSEGFHRFMADLESEPSGHWQLAGSAAANGVTWPAFGEFLQREYARYRAHPETAVPLSAKPWRSQDDRRNVLNRRTEIIASLSLYAPEGAMLPWYFETEPVDVTLIQRRYGSEMEVEHLKEYFISAMNGVRVFERAFAASLSPSLTAVEEVVHATPAASAHGASASSSSQHDLRSRPEHRPGVVPPRGEWP